MLLYALTLSSSSHLLAVPHDPVQFIGHACIAADEQIVGAPLQLIARNVSAAC